MDQIPTIGVEEEFLLVDPDSGAPVARNRATADKAADAGVDLQLELTSCQVETATGVIRYVDDLRSELSRSRRAVAGAAHDSGARLLAAGLPPTLPHEFPLTDTPRYRDIGERFGMIAHEQGICGCHVHVAVPDRDTAVRVGTRLRPWLPLLLALTANSAIYRGADSGHASWRSVLWARWPGAGPPPELDSADEYDAAVDMLLRTNVLRDAGMVYWDVRPSANFPTVEIRVSDVPATVAETVLFAALVRGCVMTALDDMRLGRPMSLPPPHVLKAASWKAARSGLTGDGVDLDAGGPAPIRVLLHRLVERIRPALQTAGDDRFVEAELAAVLERGNGAQRQQAAWARRHDVADVVAEGLAATLEGTAQASDS